MVTIYNFSEGQEDIFLIRIGEKSKTNILVDGGNGRIDFIKKIEELDLEELHYAVLTHIDQDHIKGLIKIFNKQKKYENTIVVYNKIVNGVISYRQAEQFEKLIENHCNIVSYKDYQDNQGDIVFLSVSQRRKLEREHDKIYITFLSPKKEAVQKLYEYYRYYKKNNRNKEHNAKIVNQSSIVFLLEYKDIAVLMTGDGYIEDIMSDINELSDEKITHEPIKTLNLIKIPHHGSEENNKQLNLLLQKMTCDKFIITNKFIGYGQSDVKIMQGLIKTLNGKQIYSSNYDGVYEDKKKVEQKEQIYINKQDKINL